MKKHRFYFNGTNANFASVLNAISFIFKVDVLPFLKNTANNASIVSSFRSFDDYPQDIIEPATQDYKEAIDKGYFDTLQAAYKANAVYDLVSLWDKMRTYFLDNYETKNFVRSLYDDRNTFTYTVTDKVKTIVKEPELKQPKPIAIVKEPEPKKLIAPPENSGRDEKLKYFTQLGNSKGYTWEKQFKSLWYKLANELPLLDREFVKQHVDFMINQFKNNPVVAKDNSKDEVADYKQAAEFVPTVKREKFKTQKGFLWHLFASPKEKAALKIQDETRYLKAVEIEQNNFIQAEKNTMQRNANIKKLIADKTKLLSTSKTPETLKQEIENLKKQLK